MITQKQADVIAQALGTYLLVKKKDGSSGEALKEITGIVLGLKGPFSKLGPISSADQYTIAEAAVKIVQDGTLLQDLKKGENPIDPRLKKGISSHDMLGRVAAGVNINNVHKIRRPESYKHLGPKSLPKHLREILGEINPLLDEPRTDKSLDNLVTMNAGATREILQENKSNPAMDLSPKRRHGI